MYFNVHAWAFFSLEFSWCGLLLLLQHRDHFFFISIGTIWNFTANIQPTLHRAPQTITHCPDLCVSCVLLLLFYFICIFILLLLIVIVVVSVAVWLWKIERNLFQTSESIYYHFMYCWALCAVRNCTALLTALLSIYYEYEHYRKCNQEKPHKLWWLHIAQISLMPPFMPLSIRRSDATEHQKNFEFLEKIKAKISTSFRAHPWWKQLSWLLRIVDTVTFSISFFFAIVIYLKLLRNQIKTV